MTIWQILEINITTDKKSIKKAYVKMISANHPEENPEKFKEIKNAYDMAIKYANNQEKIVKPTVIKANRKVNLADNGENHINIKQEIQENINDEIAIKYANKQELEKNEEIVNIDNSINLNKTTSLKQRNKIHKDLQESEKQQFTISNVIDKQMLKEDVFENVIETDNNNSEEFIKKVINLYLFPRNNNYDFKNNVNRFKKEWSEFLRSDYFHEAIIYEENFDYFIKYLKTVAPVSEKYITIIKELMTKEMQVCPDNVKNRLYTAIRYDFLEDDLDHNKAKKSKRNLIIFFVIMAILRFIRIIF